MGLDMYLNKRTYLGFDSKTTEILIFGDAAKHIDPKRVTYIYEEVAYWRKFNALHAWFIRHEEDDECQEVWVTWGDFEELICILKKLYSSQGDKKLAKDLLPTANGFFFGSVEYDTYYWGSVHDSLKTLLPLYEEWSKLREEDSHVSFDLVYRASW